MVQLPRDRVHGGARLGRVPGVVRHEVVVPARSARRLDHLPRPAAHLVGHLRGGPAHRPGADGERRVRAVACGLRRDCDGVHGAPLLGVHARCELGRCRDLLHGHPPRAPHALGGRRLRQREPRDQCDRGHFLLLGACSALGVVVAVRHPRRPHVHLHGRRMGRVRLRPQPGRPARARPRPLRALLAAAAQGVLVLVHHRDGGGGARSGALPRRLAAVPVDGAARAARRLRRPPADLAL